MTSAGGLISPRRVTADARRRRAVRRQLDGVASGSFRADVEGLRAVAVVVVVLFHLRIDVVSGGYVGVDVFFVVSGYLITRLLLRELADDGSISLPGFWARRARRLLPASALVLLVTVAAGRVMLSPLAMRTLAGDAVAAGAFVSNFVFAGRETGYFADAPSPLLHFWSLAVEEQFYLLWPLVLVALTRRPRQYRRLLAVVIGAGILISLLASVWMTSHRPTEAYYLLPARMGELLCGAAVALVGPAWRTVAPGVRAVLGWFGIAGIAVAVFGYDDTTQFPGMAALLPVLSTVLVLAAGGDGGPATGPVVALRHPVAQWIGKHSYAIYLWHWPPLVLAEARYGEQPLGVRVVILAGAVGLAVGSVRFIEAPVRHSSWLAVRPARGLALGASLCAAALVAGTVAGSGTSRLDGGEAAAAPVLDLSVVAAPTTATPVAPVGIVQPGVATAPGPTVPDTTSAVTTPTTTPTTGVSPVTPAALAAGGTADLATLVAANRAVLDAALTVDDVPSNLQPSLAAAGNDKASIYADDCVAIGVESDLTPCRYGAVGSATSVVLYGDSHAAQWFPALEAIANDRGFELVVLTKGGCPTAAVSIPTNTLSRTCPVWRDAVIDFLATERPDAVIVTAWAGYPNDDDEWSAGFDDTLARVAQHTANLVVLGDNPPSSRNPADCLSAHVTSASACNSDRADVAPTSRHEVERAVTARYGGRFVDTTDWLCTATECPVILGDILLFRDADHLTTAAAVWFRPLLQAALAGIV